MAVTFSRTLFQDDGCLEPGVVHLYADLVTSTGGTVSSSRTLGVTVTKTNAKTGRYTCQVINSDGSNAAFKRLLSCTVIVEGAADAAYTGTAGSVAILRGVSPTTGLFYVQMIRPDTSADAEVIDAATIRIKADIQISAARS